MPAIRNRLLLLFSSQKFDEVRTVEGREKLRADTVVAVNEALGLTKKRHKIEDAYFTAFVIQ
jgi:flagellar FliL protein